VHGPKEGILRRHLDLLLAYGAAVNSVKEFLRTTTSVPGCVESTGSSIIVLKFPMAGTGVISEEPRFLLRFSENEDVFGIPSPVAGNSCTGVVIVPVAKSSKLFNPIGARLFVEMALPALSRMGR
jgi:hypothetical protein